jgi:hypothetical protein
MSVLKANLQVTPQELYVSSTTQATDLGAYATTGDGRVFRYFLNGAVAALPGRVYQGPAQDATNQTPSGGLGVAAAAAGATTVTLTDSLTLSANLLAGGYMSIAVTPGLGYLYKIRGNTAVSAATGCVVTLEDPIVVALTSSSKVLVNKSPYDGAVIVPATITGTIIGVAVTNTPIANYGWIQTHGPASALVTGTFASAGLAVGVLVGGTIGSLAPAIAGTNVLGYTMTIAATGQCALVNLCID